MFKKINYEELSIKVHREILKKLRKGDFNDTGRLPPEEIMAKELGISRGVLRDVLANLESEGYISRRRGVGTIVNKHVLQSKTRLDVEKDFLEMITDAGYTSRVEYAKGKWIKADGEPARRLAVLKGSNILKIEKLIYADDDPAVYLADYVPEDIFMDKKLNEEEFSIPIFTFIKKKCGLAAETVLMEVDACSISDEIAGELKLKPGTPVLCTHELAYTFDFKPILWSDVYYQVGLFKMTLLRKNYLR